MDKIRSIYADDPDMLDIVAEFAQEASGRATEFESCLDRGDHATLQTLAHQLKGAGGGYGYPQITDAAAQVERALKEGEETSVVKDRLTVLCEILRAVEVVEAD